MKNMFKILGSVALAAVLGFSGVSCSNGSTSNNNTYTAVGFALHNASYITVFGGAAPPAGTFNILPGTKAELTAKVTTAVVLADSSDDVATGLSYSYVEGELQNFVEQGIITSPQKTQILTELSSKGYGVAVLGLSGEQLGYTGVLATYKE